MASKFILGLTKTNNSLLNHVQRRYMPVNVPPTATGKRRFRKEVETDPHKLVNYCCGLNYHIDEPMIKLKNDNEYPDWLWNLRLHAKPNSWEMEHGTKEYYLRLRDEEKDRNYLRRMTTERKKKVVGKVLKSQQEYLHRLRFAALAHLEDDAGLDELSMESDWQEDTNYKLRRSDYYLPPEDRVLYMDKIPGNTHLKNYRFDDESSFKYERRIEPHPPNETPAIYDSRRRHRYATT